MNERDIQPIVEDIDAIHREFAQIVIGQMRGTPYALTIEDVLESRPGPLRSDSVSLLRRSIESAQDPADALRLERIFFGCVDLALEKETCALADMLNFYFQHGRMHVGSEKVPTPEVVSWLQSQTDFDKREEMRKENTIYLKGILNPILTGMLELTVRVTTERFGFDNYARFSEAKKRVSFQEQEALCERFLKDTDKIYTERIGPWVEQEIGRSIEGLSRYHALYLMRIRKFDAHFPLVKLRCLVDKTFLGLGFDLASRKDIVLDVSTDGSGSPDGLCVGVEIPGEVHVLMRPVGGLIDVETLLHETGHAFFLSNFDPKLPVEYRRLYGSAALDEAFAFLFMDLVGNPSWLTKVAELPARDADELAELVLTKRLCLIRRHMGKFLAEKELHEKGDIKDSGPYCRHLKRATGFEYEPQGYLIDMQPDFYSLDYVTAWAGAHALQVWLEEQFGGEWFAKPGAGEFLRDIAAWGRREPLQEVVRHFCGTIPSLPTPSGD